MSRKLLLVGLSVLLPLSLIIVDTQTAWAAPPPAHGSVNCPVIQGTGTVTPGLTPAGSPGGVKINFHAVLGPLPSSGMCGGAVTAPAGVIVKGGKINGSGFFNAAPPAVTASSCANFATTDVVGTITVTIAWITSGPPIAQTRIVYSNLQLTVTVAGGHDTITLRKPPGPGTVVKSGSFAFPPTGAPNTTRIKTTLPGPGCGPGPWTGFTIVGGAVTM
jgi:hypothetical protein